MEYKALKNLERFLEFHYPCEINTYHFYKRMNGEIDAYKAEVNFNLRELSLEHQIQYIRECKSNFDKSHYQVDYSEQVLNKILEEYKLKETSLFAYQKSSKIVAIKAINLPPFEEFEDFDENDIEDLKNLTSEIYQVLYGRMVRSIISYLSGLYEELVNMMPKNQVLAVQMNKNLQVNISREEEEKRSSKPKKDPLQSMAPYTPEELKKIIEGTDYCGITIKGKFPDGKTEGKGILRDILNFLENEKIISKVHKEAGERQVANAINMIYNTRLKSGSKGAQNVISKLRAWVKLHKTN
jgi:hypothetical protein